MLSSSKTQNCFIFAGSFYYYLGEILLRKSFHQCINWDISFLEGKMTGREFGDFSQVFWGEGKEKMVQSSLLVIYFWFWTYHLLVKQRPVPVQRVFPRLSVVWVKYTSAWIKITQMHKALPPDLTYFTPSYYVGKVSLGWNYNNGISSKNLG